MKVRSIIFFEANVDQEERFKSEFGALRDAVGFPGFLGSQGWEGRREAGLACNLADVGA